MSNAISVSEARAALPDVIARVLNGEEITLTRHGVPVAVLVRPDALRARRATPAMIAADRVRALLDDGKLESLATGPSITAERADALVADVRRSRTATAPGRG
jgi:prevent-host-death family protein